MQKSREIFHALTQAHVCSIQKVCVHKHTTVYDVCCLSVCLSEAHVMVYSLSLALSNGIANDVNVNLMLCVLLSH